MTARCIMVLGTTSGAGKSWLATALCRYYARQGLKVAPFKAQNMSNNARVVASADANHNGGHGEIGSAQYFQALAACALPDVRMNPLLLKPEHDTHSQVVLMGQVSETLSAMPWRERSQHVWPAIAQCLDQLRASHDVVVIEGAGSPAEINLADCDIVNMRVAMHAQAACLLVTDIDRGGAFAHLYGTWALLPSDQRARIQGYVLNKFRGDASLLAPAPQMLQDLTGVPTVATLPMWWQHGLPEEDGIFEERSHSAGAVTLTVAIIAYPRISNLDEFQPLKNIPGLRLIWVRSPTQLKGLAPCDWLVLPGSKHTSGDLAWLRQQGLDGCVQAHAQAGGLVLGICGGLQMLGTHLSDPHHVDGSAQGLRLLGVETVFAAHKTVRHSRTRFATPAQPWARLAGVEVQGYEIHHGQTQPVTHSQDGLPAQIAPAQAVLPHALGWQNPTGNVLGVYLHGLFENPAVLQALFGSDSSAPVPTLETVFEGLADFVEQHFSPGVLQSLGGA
jgi:adenosylcobyric acid synthase